MCIGPKIRYVSTLLKHRIKILGYWYCPVLLHSRTYWRNTARIVGTWSERIRLCYIMFSFLYLFSLGHTSRLCWSSNCQTSCRACWVGWVGIIPWEQQVIFLLYNVLDLHGIVQRSLHRHQRRSKDVNYGTLHHNARGWEFRRKILWNMQLPLSVPCSLTTIICMKTELLLITEYWISH